ELKGFTEKVMKLVREPYFKFIDVGLPKLCFSLQLFGLVKEECIKRPAISSVKIGFQKLDDYLVQPKKNYSEIWPQTFSSEDFKLEESRKDSSTFKHNLLNKNLTTTLIRSLVASGKTKTLRKILDSLAKNRADLPCETIKILYDPDKGSEAIHRGLKMLQKVYFGQMDGKQQQNDFVNINATWSSLDCIVYTSIIEAGISFKISNHFDAVIGISNINTRVHAEAFAQMFYQTYIEIEYQKRLLAKYFSEILCSLIASTRATLELILAKDTEKVNRNKISHTIKNIEKQIKNLDAESIANALDISSNEAEILKQNPKCSFANNMTLQHHYLWRTYALGFSNIDNTNILSGDDTKAKGLPNLKATVKLINAIVENWYSYTIKSSATHVGSKEHQLKSIDKIQELFNSISITTNITILEEAKLQYSELSSNEICEESSCNKFLIKNKSDIDILILLLQQKFQMSQERLEQWKTKIAFEFQDNINYWKKERESINKVDFLEY
ncbi:14075_t:CDS:10, partial [Cetraspora pellucida]